MRKREFLKELRLRLNRIECDETEDIVGYYEELIEDTIDRTGKTEEEVVYDLGPISEIIIRVNPKETEKVEKIKYDAFEEGENVPERIPDSKQSTKKEKGNHRILILILTSPLWLVVLFVIGVAMLCSVAVGIGIAIAGISSVGYGITILGAQLANALFRIGLGVACIGGALIAMPIIMKIIALLGKLTIRFVRWLNPFSNSKKQRLSYEN